MHKTVGNNAANESKEQGAEEELQEDSPVTKFVITVANINCNLVTGVQSAGKGGGYGGSCAEGGGAGGRGARAQGGARGGGG